MKQHECYNCGKIHEYEKLPARISCHCGEYFYVESYAAFLARKEEKEKCKEAHKDFQRYRHAHNVLKALASWVATMGDPILSGLYSTDAKRAFNTIHNKLATLAFDEYADPEHLKQFQEECLRE
jgi:hypothetical protein